MRLSTSLVSDGGSLPSTPPLLCPASHPHRTRNRRSFLEELKRLKQFRFYDVATPPRCLCVCVCLTHSYELRFPSVSWVFMLVFGGRGEKKGPDRVSDFYYTFLAVGEVELETTYN